MNTFLCPLVLQVARSKLTGFQTTVACSAGSGIKHEEDVYRPTTILPDAPCMMPKGDRKTQHHCCFNYPNQLLFQTRKKGASQQFSTQLTILHAWQIVISFLFPTIKTFVVVVKTWTAAACKHEISCPIAVIGTCPCGSNSHAKQQKKPSCTTELAVLMMCDVYSVNSDRANTTTDLGFGHHSNNSFTILYMLQRVFFIEIYLLRWGNIHEEGMNFLARNKRRKNEGFFFTTHVIIFWQECFLTPYSMRKVIKRWIIIISGERKFTEVNVCEDDDDNGRLKLDLCILLSSWRRCALLLLLLLWWICNLWKKWIAQNYPSDASSLHNINLVIEI